MRVLREGSRGNDVQDWQEFLAGEGFGVGSLDGIFGQKTTGATKRFQKENGLVVDGVVGAQTLRRAMELGFDPFDWPGAAPGGEKDPYFPPLPQELRALSFGDAQRLYGTFQWRPAPTPEEPRAIRILGNWQQENIVMVEVPQLAQIRRPVGPRRAMHRRAAESIVKLWSAWEEAGLLHLVRTFDGLFNPRVIGKSTVPSLHAFGVAFDINAGWNSWGGQPAPVGAEGSVRLLVPIANELGFFWGGHYRGKKDGMHFELADPEAAGHGN